MSEKSDKMFELWGQLHDKVQEMGAAVPQDVAKDAWARLNDQVGSVRGAVREVADAAASVDGSADFDEIRGKLDEFAAEASGLAERAESGAENELSLERDAFEIATLRDNAEHMRGMCAYRRRDWRDDDDY